MAGKCKESYMRTKSEEVEAQGKKWKRMGICCKGGQGSCETTEPKGKYVSK
jgi:hypothetical protein